MVRKKIGILILAAGQSARLGRPKQIIRIQGKTLLQNAVEAALAVTPYVYVVLGAYSEKTEPHIADYAVHILHNRGWKEGMGSSIRLAMEYIHDQQSGLDSLILSVCDQPKLSAAVFEALIQKKEATGKGIIAAVYQETCAVPALFNASFFHELAACKGDKGARHLFQKYQENCATIPFDDGAWDVDVEDDIRAY